MKANLKGNGIEVAQLMIVMIFVFFFQYRDVKTSRDTSVANTRGRGRGRGGAGAGRSDRGKASGPGSKAPRNAIVASSGLFSEGAGDGSTKRLFRSFRGQNDDATPSSLRRPTLSSKREKIDPQAEQKHISEIYDLDETDDCIITDVFSPINLTQGKKSNEIPAMTAKLKLNFRFVLQ